MKVPFVVPDSAMPKKDPENPCPCQDKRVYLEFKTGLLMWTVALNEPVKEGQVLCEGEVEKKALEFLSPADGILVEKCLDDDDEFEAGAILGYIETKD